MKRLAAVALFVLFAFAIGVWAQDDGSTAPVVWERYRVGDQKISIMLPKLPTVISRMDACHELDKSSNYAYAEGAVYEFTVVSKVRAKIPLRCSDMVPFGESTLTARLTELRGEKLKNVETSETRSERQVFKFDGEGQTRWIFADMKKNRWVELAISRYPDTKVDEEQFVNSLDLMSQEGKEIGTGSSITLGDADLKPSAVADSPKSAAATEAPRFIAKTYPAYTEQARKNRVTGNVSLRVTLLANGAVGTIEVVKGLDDGLTEQAIAVAKKIVFLPQRINGVPISVTKMMEYGFSIY